MTKTIRRSLSVFTLLVSLLGAAMGWVFGFAAAENFLIAFWSAVLVVAASTYSYKQMVSTAPEHSVQLPPDVTEKMDDRFELWRETIEEEKEMVPDAANVKTVLADEKARLQNNRLSWRARLQHARPALSLYRLIAYGILLYSLVYLISHDHFSPLFYFLGVGVATFGIATILYRSIKDLNPKNEIE